MSRPVCLLVVALNWKTCSTCNVSFASYSSLKCYDRQRLKRDIANLSLHPTDKQREVIVHRTNALQRRIDSWTRYQQLYMPTVSPLRSSAEMSSNARQAAFKPQDFLLYLPSALDYLDCDRRLMEYEWEIRLAQAHDALNELRSQLRLR